MSVKKSIIRFIIGILCISLCFGLLPAFAATADEADPASVPEPDGELMPEPPLTLAGSALNELRFEELTFQTTDDASAGEYPWALYQGTALISGNQKVSSSVSVLKLTVSGPGTLSFAYRVYSLEQGSGSGMETNPDSLLISVGTPITKSTSYTGFTGQRYYGADTGWQPGLVVIDAQEGFDTDIYFAYKKNGSGDSTNDCALLKNFAFHSGNVTVTAVSSDETYGTVSGSCEVLNGESVTLTATPKEGGAFFGWASEGRRLETTDLTYTFIPGKDMTVTAIFGSAADTVIQNRTTGDIFTEVGAALAASQTGEKLMLLQDAALTADAEIPAGVTLYIPYSEAYDADGNADGTTNNSGSAFATAAQTFRRMTIDDGVTLAVKGELLIGGVMSYPSQLYQGHTSGAHGRITNHGTITVSGGQIDCYGFIDGTGTVEAVTGTVYEPFVVLDFAGGSNSASLYFAGQNSFTEYTMQNISCTLVIHDTASLKAYCNLYASSSYNKTTLTVIGSAATAPEALIVLSSGGVVTRTVDKSLSIPGGIAAGSYGSDIGRVTTTIAGGAVLNGLAITIEGIKISVSNFPIPYIYRYVLTNGDYTMPSGWDIMPGAELEIAAGAALSVAGRLFVLTGLVNTGMSGKYYPGSVQLAANGFSTCGVLKANGTLKLQAASRFGGVIQTDGTGRVLVAPTAVVSHPSVQFGALGHYDDNTCIMPLYGQLRSGDALVNLEPGMTYTAANDDGWTMESYTVTSYAKELVSEKPESGKYEGIPNTKNGSAYGKYSVYDGPLTVTTNQTMSGTFTPSGSMDYFELVNKTHYDPTDATRTTISEPTLADGSATFTVARTAAGSSYNYLVQYSMDGSDPVTLTPDANGVYTISSFTGKVTITVTSVLKGDVNLDGEVAGNDVTKLRKFLAGYTTSLGSEFNSKAADCNGDDEIAGNDVTRLRKFLAGYTSSL